jgi:hypothetical protein
MLTPNLFEEMLAASPADKRELARQVYYRFAEGDSTQFFTQLFIVLDIYAHYAERIPQTVIEANQSAHANLTRLRDEINLLAQGIDRRNVNITNHAEKTDQLCHDTIAACAETSQKVETLVQNIGAQVNTQAIVDGIHAQLEKGIRDEIIAPFIQHSQELGKLVVPTLKEIKEASSAAHTLWMKHIWKTAWAGTFLFTFTLFFMATVGIYKLFENYSERKTAEKIASVEQMMNYNQEAFRQLAVAQVPVKVVRTQNGDVLNPRGFALVIENADAAEMHHSGGHDNGVIFFSSDLSEEMIQGIQSELAKAAQKLKQTAK